MIILYILGGLLFLLVLLLLIPVTFSFEFRESLSFTLKYGFIDLTKLLLHGDKEDKKPKKKKAEKPEEKAVKEKPEENQFLKIVKANGVGGFLSIVKSLLVIITKRVAGIIKAVHLKECDVYLCVGGEDAAEIATAYGKICAFLYPGAQVLFKFFRCKKGRATVDLNYEQKEMTVIASGTASVFPVSVIFEGLRLIVQSVPYILKLLLKSNTERSQL